MSTMKVGKSHIGTVLAIICLAMLLSTFFVPSWTIERTERIVSVDHIYVNSTHDFKLLGVSTLHEDTHSGQTDVRHLETAYLDIEGSNLGLIFLVMTLMVTLASAFIVIYLVLMRLSKRRRIYRDIALGLGFAVIFLALGSGAYLNLIVPSAVGDSRESLGIALETDLTEIRTFAGSDFEEPVGRTITTTWGPSIGWYLVFIACVVMLFSIWFAESPPKTEEELED